MPFMDLALQWPGNNGSVETFGLHCAVFLFVYPEKNLSLSSIPGYLANFPFDLSWSQMKDSESRRPVPFSICGMLWEPLLKWHCIFFLTRRACGQKPQFHKKLGAFTCVSVYMSVYMCVHICMGALACACECGVQESTGCLLQKPPWSSCLSSRL